MRIKTRAVTVAEVMMALGIVAIAILAMVTGFIGAIEMNARAVDTAVASQVGRDFLERVNEFGYENVPEGTFLFSGASNDPQTAEGFPPAPYPRVQANGQEHTLTVRVSTKAVSYTHLTLPTKRIV